MRTYQAFLPLVAATLLITACGNKEPAASVLTQADAAVEKVRVDGTQYAAEELKIADASLAKMKADFAKEDYDTVIADVPKFNTEVKTVMASIASAQTAAAAAQTEWQALNEEVPKSVEAIQGRVDKLAKARLPKEVTKETFAAAKTELAAIKVTWAEATAAASSGDTLEAASKGRTVQAKAEKLKTDLAMSPDPKMASIAAPAPTTN